MLLHQLPHFDGAAVRGLNDQPAGVVLLRGLGQQLLQHGNDRTWTGREGAEQGGGMDKRAKTKKMFF